MGTVHGRRTAAGPHEYGAQSFLVPSHLDRSNQPNLGTVGSANVGPIQTSNPPQVLAGGPHNLHHIPRCTRPHRPAIDSFNDGPPSTGRDHIFLVDAPTLINAPTTSVASTSETETR